MTIAEVNKRLAALREQVEMRRKNISRILDAEKACQLAGVWNDQVEFSFAFGHKREHEALVKIQRQIAAIEAVEVDDAALQAAYEGASE